MGLINEALNLLKKTTFVQIHNIKLEHHVISSAIPQGFVMGPLRSNIVINNSKSVTNQFNHVMYADDITVTFTLENFGYRHNAKEL